MGLIFVRHVVTFNISREILKKVKEELKKKKKKKMWNFA